MKHLLSILFSFIFFGIATAQVPSYVPAQGLKAWYSFNGNTNDLSGNANHLTNTGATLTTDRNSTANSAYSFNGTSNSMVKTTPSFIFGADSSFTVSFWSKKDNNTTAGSPFWHGLLQSQTGGLNHFVHFAVGTASGNAMKWGTNKQGSAWAWGASIYTTNTWEHWVCVYNNKSMIFYKNGVQASTTTFTHLGTLTSVMPFYLGSNSASAKYFGGKIDDVGVWRRALTAAEVLRLNAACTSVITGPTNTVTACNSYTVGGTTYTATGNYIDTLTSAGGCDSTVTTNLTINTVNKATTLSGNTITASLAGASYVWLNCDSNYAVISGATGQSFSPSQTGNFAVIVDDGTCSDTSACVSVTLTVGVNEFEAIEWSIYPNPSHDHIKIQIKNNTSKFDVRILTIHGKEVYNQKSISENSLVDISRLPVGTYVIEITTNENQKLRRSIIKQ